MSLVHFLFWMSFATPVHQEQIASEQIVHPQTRELIVEGVVEIRQECLPEGD